MVKSLGRLGLLLSAFISISYCQTLEGCPIFPADNVWNTPVDKLPVNSRSAAYVNAIGATKPLHPDFGTVWNNAPAGIAYVTVSGSQPKVPVTFRYSADSDPGPYPIPPTAPIEGGPNNTGDRHVLVVNTTNCILYELFSAYPQADGSWQAGSGAVFDLRSNKLRDAGKTSADAAGLPMLPGLVRYEEVLAGEIKHAIRFTVPRTQRAYLWPARHFASTTTDANYPPMGTRFRLKAGVDISGFPQEVQIILKALKKYGMMISDNGGAWYITGAPDPRWNDSNLHLLHKILGSSFEAVDQSSLMEDANSGKVVSQLASATTLNAVTGVQLISGKSGTDNRVYLTAPAPAGGATVSLSSSNPAQLTVPASVTVPGGATWTRFSSTAGAVLAQVTVQLTAFYIGVTKTAAVTVLPAGLKATVCYGLSYAAGSCRVDLSGAAGTPTTVQLSSSNQAVMTVPASVVVPAGAISATFLSQFVGHGSAVLTAQIGSEITTFSFTR